jgi:CheY-like chemotaxis protein
MGGWQWEEALNMLRGTGGVAAIPKDRRIILLDLNMPKMGEIEFLRELRPIRAWRC